ncbi:MAG: hypothetical protein KC420_22395 [Myxococcales bacterium]|nr:hypothetical protein [Myxococcales bacterium]
MSTLDSGGPRSAFSAQLKDYLEATGMLDERDLVDAENRALIYGGSLDTSLLELEALDPVRLDAALAAARGLLSSPPELLLQAPNRRPWEMLPEIWIEEREAVPLAFI